MTALSRGLAWLDRLSARASEALYALGVYGASVITALTAQNTCEVRAIYDVSPEFIGQQLDAVGDDLTVNAVKIGMLSQPAIIDTVAQGLARHGLTQVVLDPVMVAKSGDALLQEHAVNALRQQLLPQALLITPNLPEAGVLLGAAAPADEASMIDTAKQLLGLGPRAVLLKGGHLSNSAETSVDIFYDGVSEPLVLRAARVNTRNTHGTGCTLSAAIAAFRARGLSLDAF